MATAFTWFARGLIFENCACTLVCPGHMHFSQNCTHHRCKGYWALRFDLTRRLKEKLEAAGCSIPFPQRDLHIVTGEDLKASA